MNFSISGISDLEEVCRQRCDTKSLLGYAHKNMNLFKDIEICVENESIFAHKLILSCYSYFFESMFNSEMQEKYQKSIEVNCVDGKSTRDLIEFIYTGTLKLNTENVCKLLAASDYLQIEDAKQFCIEFLKAAIKPENCLIILAIADCYSATSLKIQVEQFIADNFVEIASTTCFKNFTKNELLIFLSKQDRSSIEETSIYIGLVEWVNYDEESRSTYFPELLKEVNFHKLPSDMLENVVSKEKLIRENNFCSKLLIEALHKHSQEIKMKQTGTTILSLGGERTHTKVFEVFSLLNKRPKDYPDLPEGRESGCCVKMSNFVYYVGGREIENLDTSDMVWRMDLTNATLDWEEIESMNSHRYVTSATIFKETLVVVGGGHRELILSSGEYYIPIADSWLELPTLNTKRFGNALVECKGRLYAIGGSSGECSRSVECLNDVNLQWTYVQPMQVSRKWLAAVSCNGFVYAIGGQHGLSSTTRLRSCEKYDVDNDTWTYTNQMSFERVGCAACVLQGKIYVIGGRDANHIVKEIECYDPWTDKWSIVGTVDEELVHHCVVAI